jgi:hypothetical protein
MISAFFAFQGNPIALTQVSSNTFTASFSISMGSTLALMYAVTN